MIENNTWSVMPTALVQGREEGGEEERGGEREGSWRVEGGGWREEVEEGGGWEEGGGMREEGGGWRRAGKKHNVIVRVQWEGGGKEGRREGGKEGRREGGKEGTRRAGKGKKNQKSSVHTTSFLKNRSVQIPKYSAQFVHNVVVCVPVDHGRGKERERPGKYVEH
jgi:hypothetical protein